MTSSQPPPFQDRIVQEVMFMILEPIYEARFSQKSFAFRRGRNAHTILRVIRRSFAGYLWYIKGDLSTLLDGVKVGMVINALLRDVRDKKVIDLIKSALVTSIITDAEPKPGPYWLQAFFGFAPEEAEKVSSWAHCVILSPLLANICLNELDHWMEGRVNEFYRPTKTDVIWNEPNGEEDKGNTSWPEFVPTSGLIKLERWIIFAMVVIF
ncbi:hypothetical protein AMTR_s00002p00133480 [Amborella trichopoda]|uniref:Reverse transcriptase domain-containing protein n=1 Tax=Amborella trichopoda TaxID=13333 RepID=W1NZC4_AMBTC|nr:hypothetical protein AMTR_s00002p00133480 [Amborella trichopoda]